MRAIFVHEVKKMNNRKLAYIRVSSRDQNVARQLDTMLELGIDERDIFIDKASGKDFDREQYQLMKRFIREGDIIYIDDLNRLGRNKDQILQEWHEITKEIKAHIVVLNMPLLDTTKFNDAAGQFVADLVLQIFSWFAEDERRRITRNQQEGIKAAKARGVKLGRKQIKITDEFINAYDKWKNGEITALKAMELSKLKKTTFYNLVKRYEESKK